MGTLMFAPLLYPFEPWRIKHNQHHAHTNKLVEDTAWHPIMESEIRVSSQPRLADAARSRGAPSLLVHSTLCLPPGVLAVSSLQCAGRCCFVPR